MCWEGSVVKLYGGGGGGVGVLGVGDFFAVICGVGSWRKHGSNCKPSYYNLGFLK